MSSLSFMFTGLDFDLYQAEQEDLKNIGTIHKELKTARKKLFSKVKSSYFFQFFPS